MSHTLHRVGTVEQLTKDWCVLCMPSKGINDLGSHAPLKRFFELCVECDCVTLGDARSGNEFYQGSRENVINNVEDKAVITATFRSEEDVTRLLGRLKEEDLGLSVVVSGLVDRVAVCAHKVGLEPHTILSSLGRYGAVEKLPPYEICEIGTMCGHSMVSVTRIQNMIEKVKAGRLTSEKAAKELFKACMCGIFNVEKCARLIDQYIEKEKNGQLHGAYYGRETE